MTLLKNTPLKLTTCLMLAAFAAPGLAMAQNAPEADANGDGVLSIAEVQAVYPEITDEQFSALDLNADGSLDDAEVQAAQEAGVLPVTPTDG